jgi:hypothetical protein
MSEQIGVVLILIGVIVLTVGLASLLWRGVPVVLGRSPLARLGRPLAILSIGLVIGAAPFAYQQAYDAIIGKGPVEAVVDGSQALTLTGWDRDDYAILSERPDVEILEMSNPDVTDETLELLLPMERLRELSLNDAAITDAGLMTLAKLPRLEILRIARTKITPEGLEAFLANQPPRLSQLDVSGNDIPASLLRRWKNAAPPEKERRYVN